MPPVVVGGVPTVPGPIVPIPVVPVRFQDCRSQCCPVLFQSSSHGDVVITCQVTGAGGGLAVQVPGEVPHHDGGA